MLVARCFLIGAAHSWLYRSNGNVFGRSGSCGRSGRLRSSLNAVEKSLRTSSEIALCCILARVVAVDVMISQFCLVVVRC